MCRLFGLLTGHDDRAKPWLVEADRSLLAQANASSQSAQRDGWGIAWYGDGGRTHVVKGTRGAFEPGERERFVEAAGASRPPLVVGHLRRASNPMGLPPERLLGPENSQPFGDHRYLFAHNGMIPLPLETRPYLGVFERNVRGVNDSEVLAWLLIRHAEETHDPLRAYAHAVDDLVRVRKESGSPKLAPFSGLNVLFAPGPDELWAFCLWGGDHGCGLLDRSRPYYEMAYRATPHQLLVGSEPFDGNRPTWRSIPSGTYLRGMRRGEHIDLQQGPVPVPPSVEVAPPPA